MNIMGNNVPSICHEQDFNRQLLKHHQTLVEIEKNHTDKKKNKICSTSSAICESLYLELYNSLINLAKSDLFIIKFKNNQIINQLILNSMVKLIKIMKRTKKKILISLLTNLYKTPLEKNSENDDEDSKQEFNEWFKKSTLVFITIEKQLEYFLTDLDTSYDPFKDVLIDLIEVMFDMISVEILLQTDLPINSLNYLKRVINNDNSDKIINTSRKIIDYMSDAILIEPDHLLEYYSDKFSDIFSIFGKNISYLMENHEKQLYKYEYNIIGCFLMSLEAFHIHEITNPTFFSIFDEYLKKLGEKIDNLSAMDEDEVVYFSHIAMELGDSKFEDLISVNGRYYNLLKLMLKIIAKSDSFNLNNPRDFGFVNMAFNTISIMMNNRGVGIEFSYFYEQFWKLIEKPWLKIIEHEKGYIAFKIVQNFAKSYEPSQLNLLIFFIKSIGNHLIKKRDLCSREIEANIQFILIDFLKIFHNFPDCEIEILLNQVFKLYFEIGKSFNFLEWYKSFMTFSTKLLDNNFEYFLKKNNEISNTFFELTFSNFHVHKINTEKDLDTEFILNFLENILGYLSNEQKSKLKIQIIEVVDNLMNFEVDDYIEYYDKIIGDLSRINF
ncbi:unnamed protein product [Brachionus calyciflorus]|uniref:Uncharacterized protein n=1 Tax=Brachionus calyciflorus TaxID=104777 RepID=A0A814F9B1_9BILA|nr:unnamed protein product [Brachionus calyciflorus]